MLVDPHAFPAGRGTVAMSSVTTGNAINAQTVMCLYRQERDRMERSAGEGRTNTALKEGGRKD